MNLTETIRRQLYALIDWACIPYEVSNSLIEVFEILTRESLNRPAFPPFPGLAKINPNGLPFQWSFCIDNRKPKVRFLCESGTPGKSAKSRYQLSLLKLSEVCTLLRIPYPLWLDELVLPHLMPDEKAWPSDWLSAMWFAVGANKECIVLKAYLNIMRDDPLDCLERIGSTLKRLGREKSQLRLYEISGNVSRDSWPSGFAIDILPDGSPGRIKIYFRSGDVTPIWLERWYKATNAVNYLPAVYKMLDIIQWDQSQHFPGGTFFVSCEFSSQNEISLKTDLTVARWKHSDRDISRGVRNLIKFLKLSDFSYVEGLKTIGLWPPPHNYRSLQQLIGFGYESDGSYHVNVYCEPPMNDFNLPLIENGKVKE